MNTRRYCCRRRGRAPDVVQQLTVRDHFPRMTHQQRQEIELLGREMHRRPVLLYRMPGEVEADTIEHDLAGLRAAGLIRAPECRSHSRQQLADTEGLVDEVVRTKIEALDLFRLPGRAPKER